MLKKYSTIFSSLMVRLFDLEMALFRPDPSQEELTEILMQDERDELSTYTLVLARNMADELALDSVIPLLNRIEKKLKNNYLVIEAHRDVGELRSRIEDQLQARLFYFVAPGRVDYYQNKSLFGTEVADRFPGAIDDIEGAGKCLALGQGTACVMHLVRVMEVGLKALASRLGISYAPSWESYLKQIQDKIGAKYKTKGVSWKRDEPFFRDASGDLVSIKQAWRNPTMHVGRKYSPDEAEEIFRAVRTFMQRLSKA